MIVTRARAAGIAAATLALAASGAAAIATDTTDDGVIASCVSVRTGAMRLETPRQPCVLEGKYRVRERRVTWNEQGVPGADGAAGAVGPAGQVGPTGAPGPVGPTGMAGPEGRPGADGTDGADGMPGADGASLLSGDGDPGSGLGRAGDTYLDTSTGRVWSQGPSGWVETGNVRGPQGEPGADAPPGPGALLTSTSGEPVTLSWGSQGMDQGVYLPLSGRGQVPLAGLLLDDYAAVLQPFPANATVTRFTGTIVLADGDSALSGRTVSLYLLKQSSTGAQTLTPTGAVCQIEVPEAAYPGRSASCSNEVAVGVGAGELALVGAYVFDRDGQATSFRGTVSVGLQLR